MGEGLVGVLLRIPVREASVAEDGGEAEPDAADGAAAATGAAGGGLPLLVAVLVAIALALLAAGRLGRRAARRYSCPE